MMVSPNTAATRWLTFQWNVHGTSHRELSTLWQSARAVSTEGKIDCVGLAKKKVWSRRDGVGFEENTLCALLTSKIIVWASDKEIAWVLSMAPCEAIVNVAHSSCDVTTQPSLS